MILCLVNNIFASANMLLGAAAVIAAVSGMHIIAATFLIPVGVTVYTFVGGIKATYAFTITLDNSIRAFTDRLQFPDRLLPHSHHPGYLLLLQYQGIHQRSSGIRWRLVRSHPEGWTYASCFWELAGIVLDHDFEECTPYLPYPT